MVRLVAVHAAAAVAAVAGAAAVAACKWSQRLGATVIQAMSDDDDLGAAEGKLACEV